MPTVIAPVPLAADRARRTHEPLPAVDLLALIGQDTRLRRVSGTRGGEYAGPCPFCGGKDRFRVQPAHGRWWCRQCAGSDRWSGAVDYVIKRERLPFPRAAAWLRERYGDVPASLPPAYPTNSPPRPALRPTSPPLPPNAAGGARDTSAPAILGPHPEPSARDAGPDGRVEGAAAPPAGDRLTYYLYRDEIGRVLFRVRRVDLADGGKRISVERPSPDGDGWLPGIAGVRRVLYRLPELLTARSKSLIFVAEGEKCVDALVALGLEATCNPGGAGMGWHRDYSDALRRHLVVVLPDHDDAGYAHARKIAASLHGVAECIKVVPLPGLPAGGDIADWLAAGGTLDVLGNLIRRAPSWPEDPAASGAAATVDWPEPIPLTEAATPSFPLAVLPTWLREYVEALAIETQTAPDMAAMLALSMLALCGGRRARVRVRPNWLEPLCLFVLVVSRAGTRKSGVYSAVTRVARQYERAHNETLRPQILQSDALRRVLEGRLRKAELAAGATGASAEHEERIRALATELTAFTVPALLSLVEGDITPEALAVALAEQGGNLAVMAPEGGMLSTITGAQYGERGSLNLDALLNGHAGEDIKVRRVGRPPLYVADPALTLALTVQPSVLQGLSARPDYRSRGLLARFLYAIPCDLQGSRDVNPPVMPEAVRLRYEAAMGALLRLKPAAGVGGGEGRHELRLDASAHQALTAFMAWLEPQLAVDGALGGDDAWGSKLAGAVARIAALLHLASYEPGHAIHLPVREEVMQQAITLARDYLIPHARAALRTMGADPAREQATHILSWIARNRKEMFSRRDVYMDLRARFAGPADTEPALAVLCDLGHIRPIEPVAHGAGRRPSALYAAHPQALGQNTHNTRNSAPDVAGEDV